MEFATSKFTPETAIAMMNAQQSKSPYAQLTKDEQRIEKTARDFEAVFIGEMVKPMFAGIETDEMFGGGKGEEIFQGMMIQEYGKMIAEKDITGIQTQVKNKLIEMQAQRTAEQSTQSASNMINDLEIIEEQ
tara:strand:+ start:180 stop:575 length:396 start_codon:yes stop_codon:yes gene_type:complete